ASASDNVGVIKVEFYVDGNLIGSQDASSPYSVSLNTTTLTNGSHSLTAKAYDQAGNVTTSGTRTINVSNITFDDADLNQDGIINLLDFSLLAQQFGKKSYTGREDINRDGKVDILDFSVLASKYGR
ncbi:MAG: Ig-like domain-containing protein, partial [Acidobacteriota bacterium]